ncbi:hypothetical protein VTI74DRAFT_4034 [Chaetomium olivicolor]
MAGRPRRRRASSSSSAAAVAATDHAHIRWTKESAVLKPASREISDSEWPCYVLTDATIYRKDGKTLANPLLVHVEGPLVVRGLLEVDEDKILPNLVRPSLRSAYIEIPYSDRYSIGDGPLVLWVSGAAGWFEIRPSARYQPMYDQVREAITLYYGAFEVYEDYANACGWKKKAKWPPQPTLDDVFLNYAVKAGDGIVRHEVEALCHKWAEFLIAHFGKEADLDWDNTLFAKWLRGEHPDIQKRITDIANGIIPPPPTPPPQTPDEIELPHRRKNKPAKASNRASEADDNEARSSVVERSRSPQPKTLNKLKTKISETPVPLPEKYRQVTQPATSQAVPAPTGLLKESPQKTASDTPQATLIETPGDTQKADPTAGLNLDSPIDRLVAGLRLVAAESKIHKSAARAINGKLYFKCRMRNYSAVGDVVTYFAKALLPRVEAEWKGTPWYGWLREVAEREPEAVDAATVESYASQTHLRALGSRHGHSHQSTKPADKVPPNISLKGMAAKVTQNESEAESDEDLAATYTAPPMRNRRSGKGATLRLISASSKKRPHSDLDDQASGSRRGRKSAKTSHPVSDEDEFDDAEETSGDEAIADEDMGVGSRLPLPEGAVRVVIHAERIPTTSPSGPDGTWTCHEEDCTYVVRCADEQGAQELIQQHFRDHEARAEKINLAVKESRGQMPINHLLDKIQAIHKTSLLKKSATLNGQPVPAPVKRRLLI